LSRFEQKQKVCREMGIVHKTFKYEHSVDPSTLYCVSIEVQNQ
jgi:hypothetical protein